MFVQYTVTKDIHQEIWIMHSQSTNRTHTHLENLDICVQYTTKNRYTSMYLEHVNKVHIYKTYTERELEYMHTVNS